MAPGGAGWGWFPGASSPPGKGRGSEDSLQPPGNWLLLLKLGRSALGQWLAGLEAEVSSLVVGSPRGPLHPTHTSVPQWSSNPAFSLPLQEGIIASDPFFCLWSPSQVEVQIHFHPEAPSWLLPPPWEASSAISWDRLPPRPRRGLFCPCSDPNTAFLCAPGK